jgi:hypothetical protein
MILRRSRGYSEPEMIGGTMKGSASGKRMAQPPSPFCPHGAYVQLPPLRYKP